MRIMREAISIKFFGAAVAVILSVAFSFGQNGSVDTTFGTGGIGTVAATAGAPVGSVIDSNGRILILLEYGNLMEIACFTPDGQPDTTFGTNGLLTATWSTGGLTAIALQNDGGVEKIVVGGYTGVVVKGRTLRSMRVDRYLADGTLDGTFGDNGSAVHRAASVASSITTDAAGNIYTADIDQKKLVKLAPGGALASFGSGGVVDTSSLVSGRAIEILADGKILVAGTASAKNKVSMSVARYNANGTVDTTFGTSGRTTLLVNGNPSSQAWDIEIDPAGKIVLVGTTNTGGYFINDLALVRLTPGGQPDQSFSLDGMVSLDLIGGEDYFRSVDLQDDGKIVVGGHTRVRTGDTLGQPFFSMARFHSDGSLDTLFGNNGLVITDPLPQYSRGKYGRTIFARGNKLILAGFAYGQTTPNFATVVRYDQ